MAVKICITLFLNTAYTQHEILIGLGVDWGKAKRRKQDMALIHHFIGHWSGSLVDRRKFPN